jgi:hypothetical protein
VSWQVIRNYKVIKKNLHEYNNVLMKRFGNDLLINGQFIFDTKWHHNPHKSPLIYHKGDFVLVLRCNWYLMISWKLILKIVHFMSNDCVNNLINERQWVRVLVVMLNFLKWTQILNFPFFLGTTTIGNSQVASSTNLMKPTTSNLFMSCLTMAT